MKKYRYVGVYGGRSRAAAVPHIGDLFRGDEVFHDEEAKLLRFVRPNMPAVEATDQALSVLRGGDFDAELACEHRNLAGEGCPKKPMDGSKFCRFHARLQAQDTLTVIDNMPNGPNGESGVPSEPPLPPDLVSDPNAALLESVPPVLPIPEIKLQYCSTTGRKVGGCDPNGTRWKRCPVCNPTDSIVKK